MELYRKEIQLAFDFYTNVRVRWWRFLGCYELEGYVEYKVEITTKNGEILTAFYDEYSEILQKIILTEDSLESQFEIENDYVFKTMH